MKISQCYDTHGRVTWVSLEQGAAECVAGTGPTTYVAGQVGYASHGAVKQVVLGNFGALQN